MATDNYLITGYHGKPHVTSENDRGINAGIFGAGRYVLPVGKQFRAENIGNNTIRVFDGKLVDNGAAAGIPVGEYVDISISNASQGMKRNDLIVFFYIQDTQTMVETGRFLAIQGTETSGTASDPDISSYQSDLLSGSAVFDMMPLWRIPVSTGTIGTPVQLFEVSKSLADAGSGNNIVVDAISSNGSAYTATVEDLEELYNGLEITIIPNIASTTTAPTLNVNGLGAKPIRLSLSQSNTIMVQPNDNAYYAAGRPIKLMFDSNYLSTGVWKVMGKQKPSAQDLYGTTPVISGGTGLESVAAGSFLIGNGTEPMQVMTAAEVFDAYGGDSLEMLWENANYSSSFAAQTITVNGLSDYDFIIMIMTYGIVKMTTIAFEHALIDRRFSDGYFRLLSRSVRINGNSVQFSDCTDVGIMDSRSPAVNTDNTVCVPFAICGVRGKYMEE